MATLIHVLIFACSVAIIWFFAGVLIDSVGRIAHRFNMTGFLTSFFVLGFLTSLSEISVAINATIQGVPVISVGNLLGASFVLLMFVIPLLSVIGNGIDLKNTISKGHLALALAVVFLPALLVMDGTVTKGEGLLSLLVYGCLLYVMYRQRGSFSKEPPVMMRGDVIKGGKMTLRDLGRVVIAAVAVFAASKLLVEQAVYFSSAFGIPASIVGIILLSVGTNIPELVVVARAILKRHKDIAFGDYIGSAAVNTFIFGALASVNGQFSFDPGAFSVLAALTFSGFLFFYAFAQSNARIARLEGIILLAFYACFLVFYISNLASGLVR